MFLYKKRTEIHNVQTKIRLNYKLIHGIRRKVKVEVSAVEAD